MRANAAANEWRLLPSITSISFSFLQSQDSDAISFWSVAWCWPPPWLPPLLDLNLDLDHTTTTTIRCRYSMGPEPRCLGIVTATPASSSRATTCRLVARCLASLEFVDRVLAGAPRCCGGTSCFQHTISISHECAIVPAHACGVAASPSASRRGTESAATPLAASCGDHRSSRRGDHAGVALARGVSHRHGAARAPTMAAIADRSDGAVSRSCLSAGRQRRQRAPRTTADDRPRRKPLCRHRGRDPPSHGRAPCNPTL